MSIRATAYGAILSLALGGLCVLPPSALAGSGGNGLTPGTTPSTGAANGFVTASEEGMTISTRASTVLRGRLRISGQITGLPAGTAIEIERLGHETGWQWAATVQARVAANGTFSAVWHVNHIGRFSLRAVVLGSSSMQAADVSASSPATPAVTITVYRLAVATIYGPGLWGNRTACGETLKRGTIGVANRTLPCGTKVALYYHGRALVVPVIDRGPYANGADWDLTEATASRLGIDTTVTIGAVSLPAQTS